MSILSPELPKLDALRAELAGPDPSPIERVVACWLQVYDSDSKVTQAGKIIFREADYLQRQQDSAHRRYLSAIKTLATVRRLALPIRVDVNVAGTVETRPTESAAPPRPRWLSVPQRN